MIALGMDTSNYATSLAVVDTRRREVISFEKRFLPVKAGETGLRQNDAVFHHTAAIPELIQKMESLNALHEINVVGVTNVPRPCEGSYMPCFLAGVSAATAFAAGAKAPLIHTSHQQGHLAAALWGCGKENLGAKKILFFHLSGGTTEIVLTEGYSILEKLGGSLDLYAGQAIDRLGVRLGYPFPAGEAVSLLAEACADEIDPPVSVRGLDCNMSGLENQCDALLKQGKPHGYVTKYCLMAIKNAVKRMIENARGDYPGFPVLCAGGVMCSGVIRRCLKEECRDVYFAPAEYSSDNAVGVALIAAKECAANG